MPLADLVPPAWRAVLDDALQAPSFAALDAYLREERARAVVFPPEDRVFSALALTPPSAVRVVLLGQDPYHQPGQAHGLAFSVRAGVKKPPSLVHMLRELSSDLGVPEPPHGCLAAWGKRGVLLLNTILTVREGEPCSHQKKGWEPFTDAVLRAVNDGPRGACFVLWGAHAQKKRRLVDETRHAVVAGVHPSPLSAHRGFFGSKPYSRVNGALVRMAREPVDWSLPAVPDEECA